MHLTATLTASAPHQRLRGRSGPGLLLSALTCASTAGRDASPTWSLFAVDASGSMAARRRMEAVKGAVLSLLLDAYQRRDKVGLDLLPRRRSGAAAAAHLIGGRGRAPAGNHARGRADARWPPG